MEVSRQPKLEFQKIMEVNLVKYYTHIEWSSQEYREKLRSFFL